MTGSERRTAIMDQIKNSDRPVSGSALAKTFQVSRQVIVQDIALIRAEGNNVISTNRGYILNAPHTVSRIFKVHHTDADLRRTLRNCGLGGKVINVCQSQSYGHI